ncbi:polysaccharide deacetylase family protein [Pontibacter mangrovi]|uniref:Polysaccharide deacetylase family protein n=1 Tax=Pontibacter mangrovi TaxID=2589816 RepID=A0A501WA98_9BACT|nr:polysaccharide deacetylase family protein [Pontibacter mangrovi]TPE42506.1 polysaccharide deacetylase family protein [Pontibacter mangrovi]
MDWNVRNLLTCAFAYILILLGFVKRAKKKALSGDRMIVLYFHNPTRNEFKSCVKWLKKNGFVFLSMADLDEIRLQDLPLPKGGVLLTLDDGWQTNEANVIELAEEYQVPITIFVSSEPVEQGVYWWSYLDRAEELNLKLPLKASLKKVANAERMEMLKSIREQVPLPREAMTIQQVSKVANSKYVTIGGHTHTHPILVNCTTSELFSELKTSKEKLETWTGKRVKYFAYPNGDYGKREIGVLSDLRYKMAFTCEPRFLTKECLANNYALPRFGLVEGASMAENICRMVGLWKPLMLSLKRPSRRKPARKSAASPDGYSIDKPEPEAVATI